jgi:hypothetical protein
MRFVHALKHDVRPVLAVAMVTLRWAEKDIAKKRRRRTFR